MTASTKTIIHNTTAQAFHCFVGGYISHISRLCEEIEVRHLASSPIFVLLIRGRELCQVDHKARRVFLPAPSKFLMPYYEALVKTVASDGYHKARRPLI